LSKKLKDLIAEIKFKTKLTQEQIAQRAGYTRPYLSNAIKSEDDRHVYDKLSREFAENIQNVRKGDEIAVLNAQVKVLTRELARLSEIVTKVSALDIYADLEKKMKSEITG